MRDMEPAGTEDLDEPEPQGDAVAEWSLLPSPSSLGYWLAHRTADGPVVALASPGVSLSEGWDSDELLRWRRAVWHDADGFDFATAPDEVCALAGLDEALTYVPRDAVADMDVHAWMIAATERHADALERLSRLQEHQTGLPGVGDAVEKLRMVARQHREQAARCASQPSPLVAVDRSPRELAQAVVSDPDGVLARVDRDLQQRRQLTTFAAALEQLDEEFGAETVRDALTSLVFAKHNSYSWQATRYVRQAHRTARHAAQAMQRLIAAAQDVRSEIASAGDAARDVPDKHNGAAALRAFRRKTLR